ncbi:MAG: TetR/AcrR family transcriptional regulator [Myxococcales bacterium]|nr:TetR/AcrR family transcriptional regulator [Myxococcales bacterium]
MGRPKDADSAQTFERILAATLSLLTDQVEPKLPSLRAVAKRADVSLGTIQYYFDSKDQLLEACLDGYHERLGALGASLIGEVGRLEGRALVEHAIGELYRFARRERGLLRLRVASTVAQGELPPSRQRDFMGALAEQGARFLEPHVEVAGLDARLAIHAMSAMIVRFALMSDSEATWTTGLEGEAAHRALGDYAVRAGRRLVRPSEG